MFVPDELLALCEMRRVLRPVETIAEASPVDARATGFVRGNPLYGQLVERGVHGDAPHRVGLPCPPTSCLQWRDPPTRVA